MRSLIFALLFLATTAHAAEPSSVLLARAWPVTDHASLEDLGAGIGIVFTPDLSVPSNCDFFRTLGFACFASADWLEVLGEIHAYNGANPDKRIRTLILETHGTNGHGLKLQDGKAPGDARSYVAVAALQEILEPVGVQSIILSACNSGRLLRPAIYRRLNRSPGDKLFLPATRGILDATDSFDEKRSRVTVITPARSHIETTVVGSVRELSPTVRGVLADVAKRRGITLPRQFAISEMLIQLLLRSEELELRTGAHVDALSGVQTSAEESEKLFRAFVEHLDTLAGRAAKPTERTVAVR